MSSVDQGFAAEPPSVKEKQGLRGLFPSRKTRQQIPYKNILVRDAILLLEVDPDVTSFFVSTKTFKRFGERSKRKIPLEYTHRLRGHILLDVQSARDTKKVDTPGFIESGHPGEQARSYDLSRYEIWDEDKIRSGYRLKNAELIVMRQAIDLDDSHVMSIRFVLRAAGDDASLAEIRAKSNLGTNLEPALFSLLASGEVRHLDPDRKLDEDSRIAFGRK